MVRPTNAERLSHMIDAIEQIEAQIVGLDQRSFASNRFRQLGIERCLEIISEASRHIPNDAQLRHPEIPWRQVADIGNRIRHSYHAIDSGIVWDIVTGELLTLKAAVLAMQKSN